MVNVIKFLLPLVTVLSATQAAANVGNVDDILKNINVPAKYVIQDIELARNNQSATYDDYTSLNYISEEVNKLVDIPDNDNRFEKRGICSKILKIKSSKKYVAYMMCLAGSFDLGCLLDGGQKLDRAWGCCSADCMKEPSEFCRASCFSTKGARPNGQCMGC